MNTVAVISVLVFLALAILGVLFLIKILREQSQNANQPVSQQIDGNKKGIR